MDPHSLEFAGIRCSYGFEGERELAPFGPQTFSLLPGQITTIEGDNGSGKTSLLRALLGEVPQATGTVSIRIEDVMRTFAVADLIRSGLRIFYIPQRVYTMFPIENCAATAAHMWSRIGRAYVTEEDRSRIFATLNMTDFFRRVRYRRCEHLTGGEAQIMAMLLGILYRPTLVLLDEPTSALSQENRPRVLELIKALLKPEDGSSVFSLIVTHDADLAAAAFQRIRLGAETNSTGVD